MTKQKQNSGSGANAAQEAAAKAAQQPATAKDAQVAQAPATAEDAKAALEKQAAGRAAGDAKAKEDAAAKAKDEAEAKAKKDAAAKAKKDAAAKAKKDAAAKAKVDVTALDRVRIGELIEEIDMRATRDFEGLLHRLQTEDGLSISDGDGGFVTVRLLGVRSRGRNPRLAVANWANAARRALRQPDPVDDPADATA